MKPALHLRVRSPLREVYCGAVETIRAEDRDGWVGLRPGRRDLVLSLPPGLLTFGDKQGEAFVAHAGGLLDLAGDSCRVLLRSATLCRDVDKVTQHLQEERARRELSASRQGHVVSTLIEHALRAATHHGIDE